MELRERGKVLAELAGQSGLAELYSLVDELHLRRREEGLQAADLGYQEQLKALIHLVHRLGRLEGAQRAVDQQLLARLKKASQHLRRAKPKGLLRGLGGAGCELAGACGGLCCAFGPGRPGQVPRG